MLPEEKPNQEQEQEKSAENARPEWLPEAYWNDENGAAEVQKLAKSLAETQTAFRNRKEEMRAELLKEIEGEKPEGVEAYKIDPADLKLPEGMSLEMTEGDPMLAGVKDWAYENGIKPAAFTKLVDKYLNTIAGQMPDKSKEREKLGENAEVRLDALTKIGEKALHSKEEWNDFVMMTQTARQVEVMEKLIDATPKPGPGTFEGEGIANTAREEIHRLMSMDGYWKGDEAITNKVLRLQERLSKRQ